MVVSIMNTIYKKNLYYSILSMIIVLIAFILLMCRLCTTAQAYINKNSLQTVPYKGLDNYSFVVKHGSGINHNYHVHTDGSGISAKLVNLRQMGESHIADFLGDEVIQVRLLDNFERSRDKITVRYDNAAFYAGMNLDVQMRISWLNVYPDSSFFPKSSRWIDISNDFADGIFYNGLTSGTVSYTFYKAGTNEKVNLSQPGDPTYLSFSSLNGMTNSLIPQSLDGGITGEWVNYENNNGNITGYVSENTGIGRYWSPEENSYVIGGLPNTPFDDYLGGPDFFTHSVNYLATNEPGHVFRFGAGYGSAWFTLSGITIKNPGTPPHEEITPPQKSVDKPIIHKQNEVINYQLKIHLQRRKNYWYYHYIKDPKTGFINDVSRYEQYTNDHFDLTDNLPKEVTLLKASATGRLAKGLKVEGNTIKVHLNKEQMNGEAEDDVINVSCIVNKLPKPTENGWSDNNPKSSGWYTFYNKAHQNEVIYDAGGDSDSNNVPVKIKRYHGIIYHYDFDHNNKGDFDFLEHIQNNKDLTYHKNFDGDNGLIQKNNVYGYENDDVNINILQDGRDKNNNRFRYCYGDQSKEVVHFNKYNSPDYDDTNQEFNQDFYVPYIVPKAHFQDTMFKIDTDKASNKLPFQLDLRAESFLYRKFSEYQGAVANINIKYNDPSSPNNGKLLYSTKKPIIDMMLEKQHGLKYTQIKGNLDTSNLTGIKEGQKVPVRITITGTNPNLIEQDYKDKDSFGFIATEHIVEGFNKGNTPTKKDNDQWHKDVNSYTAPERTIAYYGVDKVRILNERLDVSQKREATAKTGYGMKGDISLKYIGNIQTEKYRKDGTNINYVFPKDFAAKNTTIDYSKDTQKHSFENNNMMADRLDVKTADYKDKLPDLDNLKDFSALEKEKISKITAAVPKNYNDEKKSGFEAKYSFFDRNSEYDSGNITLASSKDPLAKNKNDDSMAKRKAGSRFYTPLWLKLGKYDVYFSKAQNSSTNKERLGGNWLNINENRPVDFYAHMYLAKDTDDTNYTKTHEQDDELALQPIVSGQKARSAKFANYDKGQLPEGLSAAEKAKMKAWLQGN